MSMIKKEKPIEKAVRDTEDETKHKKKRLCRRDREQNEG